MELWCNNSKINSERQWLGVIKRWRDRKAIPELGICRREAFKEKTCLNPWQSTQVSLFSRTGRECGIQVTPDLAYPWKFSTSHQCLQFGEDSRIPELHEYRNLLLRSYLNYLAVFPSFFNLSPNLASEFLTTGPQRSPTTPFIFTSGVLYHNRVDYRSNLSQSSKLNSSGPLRPSSKRNRDGPLGPIVVSLKP